MKEMLAAKLINQVLRLGVQTPDRIILALLSLVVLGAISVTRLPLNFLPKAEFPFIGVQIPYPNGVPGQVERYIARPVEEVLATLGGVQEVFSYSDDQTCFVGVQFEWGREVDVLRLVARGMTDAQIAETLFISARTVHKHLEHVFAKLGVRTRTAAVNRAFGHARGTAVRL